jgi:hypothetical protein
MRIVGIDAWRISVVKNSLLVVILVNNLVKSIEISIIGLRYCCDICSVRSCGNYQIHPHRSIRINLTIPLYENLKLIVTSIISKT